MEISQFFISVCNESLDLLLDAAPYILFGILVGGLLKVFLNPASVAAHLGKGRFSSVIKAAVFGIPLPLCSCGVLPAAASLKKQGANNGAVTAFLISTPESGVDSIAVSYALLDPIMTVARPVAAFITATFAGITENLFNRPGGNRELTPDFSCTVDGCCDGIDCDPKDHANHHTFGEKLLAGLRFAVTDLWGDLAGWFFIGLILGGLITAIVPESLMTLYLGGGIMSMSIMLAAGIPLYICATASTPIAAALLLKGVSPGTVLVFLLVGPATNITSLTVLFGVLGKRATAIYLSSLAIWSVTLGLVLDQVYAGLGITAHAVVGQAAEVMPITVQWLSAALLIAMSVKPVFMNLKSLIGRSDAHHDHHHHNQDEDHAHMEPAPEKSPFSDLSTGPACKTPT